MFLLGRNITHEKLESFITSLSLKMTLNTDRYPTETSRIAYVFSRTTGTAQSYISAKITAGQYIDWHNIFQDLQNTFSDPDPEFLAQRKLIILRQANRSFAEFFTEFNQYAPRCYDPGDGSHSFIGNQAAGQARGHHGSQVTNQQGVT